MYRPVGPVAPSVRTYQPANPQYSAQPVARSNIRSFNNEVAKSIFVSKQAGEDFTYQELVSMGLNVPLGQEEVFSDYMNAKMYSIGNPSHLSSNEIQQLVREVCEESGIPFDTISITES